MSMSNKIREKLEKFSDEQLRDQLRDRKLNATGRRTVIISRLASAISRELEAVTGTDAGNQGQSGSPGPTDKNPDSDILPPLLGIPEVGFEFPAGFVPLAAREDVFYLILACDLDRTLPDKLSDLNLSPGAKPKVSVSAQMTQPGYFSTVTTSPAIPFS